MKFALKFIAGLFTAIVVVLVGVQMFAAEVSEVVVITTRDAAGAPHRTRVWIVDSDAKQWLRCGSGASSWYQRLVQNPTLDLERRGAHATYTMQVVPAQLAQINHLMHEKYGWADSYVGLFSPHDRAIPMRLDPAGPGA